LRTGSMLSNEDYQLLLMHRLGTPLSVYQLKPGFILFLRIIGLLIVSFGLLSLGMTLAVAFKETGSQADLFLSSLPTSLYAILQGGVIYGLKVRQARSRRLIVCQDGFLQIMRVIGRNRVEAVCWNEIRGIKRDLFKYYYLNCGDGVTVTLNREYEHLDELIALIKQRSGLP